VEEASRRKSSGTGNDYRRLPERGLILTILLGVLMRKLFLTLILSVSFLCASASSLEWDWPLSDFRISSDFGYRENPIIGGAEFTVHLGVDLVPNIFKVNPKANVQVRAVAEGTVSILYPSPGAIGYVKGKKVVFKGHPTFGGLIVLKHFDSKLGINVFSLYGHLKQTWVKEGQRVKKGEGIGVVGSTGISTGPHLHFSLLYNPMELLGSLMKGK
jgi:murein DD-endopeptidase MepM/ murein hydrolase activator NlpD